MSGLRRKSCPYSWITRLNHVPEQNRVYRVGVLVLCCDAAKRRPTRLTIVVEED